MSTSVNGSQQPLISALPDVSQQSSKAAEFPPFPPPLPRLVIRVGVTGHRHLYEAACEELMESIRTTLEEFKAISHRIWQDRSISDFLSYSREEPGFQLISPLAEGSDRIVAEAARKLGFEILSPLPFLKAEYEKDFDSEESVQEFRELFDHATSVLELDGQRTSEGEAYEAVGRMVIRHSDVLIAIWDGRRERGAGGTSQVVREASSFGVPIVRIDSKAPHKKTLRLQQEPEELTHDQGHLEKVLRKIFLVQTSGTQEDRKRILKEIRTAERFFTPEITHSLFGSTFTRFRDYWGQTQCIQDQGYKALEQETQSLVSRLFQPRNTEMHDLVAKNYLWADALANHYGGLYRSSFVWTYFLGAWAVFFAFFGAITHHHAWFVTELLVLFIIGAITLLGRRNCWHERWMDFRLLAESLRQVQFLAPLGRIATSFKVPAHLQPSDPANSWVYWYFRSLLRECGLFHSKFDEHHLSLCRTALSSLVSHQIGYHNDNHSKLHRVHRRLHLAGQTSFILAFVACFAHLIVPEKWDGFSIILSIFTIVLPAFSGAFAAVSHQGDFESLSTRSDALRKRLERLRDKELPNQAPASSKELGLVAESFSDIMLSELLDWRFAFLEKRLDLPA